MTPKNQRFSPEFLAHIPKKRVPMELAAKPLNTKLPIEADAWFRSQSNPSGLIRKILLEWWEQNRETYQPEE